MLLHSGRDGKDVRVEDDVLRRKVRLLREKTERAFADRDPARESVRLSVLVEGHDQHSTAVTADAARLFEKGFLAFLQADRIDRALALHAFQARFDHLPARGVDHHRNTGDVGFPRDGKQELPHRFRRIQHRVIHVDVDDLRAVFDLAAGDMHGRLVIAVSDKIQELLRTRDVGALPDVHEIGVLRDDQRIKSAQTEILFHFRNPARGNAPDGFGNRLDVRGSRSAAAADDVQKVRFGELPENGAHDFRSLRIVSEFIGQSRVRVCADKKGSLCGKFRDVRAHFGGAERTVEPDGKKIGRVRNGNQEGFDILPREHSSAGVADRSRDHDGHAHAAFPERRFNPVNRRLAVQRVENGFNEKDVRAAVDQARGRDPVCRGEFVEGDVAQCGIRHVGGKRGGPARRPDRSRDETRFFRRLPRPCVGGLSGDLRPRPVQFVDEILKPVVRLRDGVGVEGVCFDDVRTGLQIGVVNLPDRLRAGQTEHVVVSPELLFQGLKARAPEIALGQALFLKHCPHRPVKDQDPFAERGVKVVHILMCFHG